MERLKAKATRGKGAAYTLGSAMTCKHMLGPAMTCKHMAPECNMSSPELSRVGSRFSAMHKYLPRTFKKSVGGRVT